VSPTRELRKSGGDVGQLACLARAAEGGARTPVQLRLLLELAHKLGGVHLVLDLLYLVPQSGAC
jgi:hypothetical protein